MRKKLPILHNLLHYWLHQRVILLLICLLVSLQYLQGKHYTKCMCIFPDEILDLACSVFSLKVINDEKRISLEKTDSRQFIISPDLHISSVFHLSQIKRDFWGESLHIICFKKRLFILQHFNSWNPIPHINTLFSPIMWSFSILYFESWFI